MSTRAAIYARYSTDNQSTRSVADQLALCEAHAARLGAVVTERYADAAISGQTLAQRPQFMALMRAVRLPDGQRPFDLLVVEHSDRLTRHPGDIHDIREAFAFAQVPVIQVDGGELDAMKAAVSGLVSSMTIRANTEKTIRGMKARAADGLRMGGRLYGYRPVSGKPGMVEIDQEQATVVRRIYAMAAAGLSPRVIAHRLNAEGIPGPRGPKWVTSAIGGWGKRGNGILGNEAYCGVVIWGKVKMFRDPETRKRVSRPNPPGQWQRVSRPELAIIDGETFATAQGRRAGPMAAGTRRGGRHLLSGLLRCPCCGGGMSVKDGQGDRRRIVCSTAVEAGTCSSRTPYRVARIERAVVAALRAELDGREGLQLYVREYNAERRRLAREMMDNQSGHRSELGSVTADLGRAVQAVIAGIMAPVTAAPHIARLELRKAQLETLLAQAGTAVAPVALHTSTAKRFAADMAALGQAITEAQAEGDATLTAALRKMVTTVTVHRNYELEITGNLAPLTRGEEMVAGERLDCFPPATLVIPFIITAAA
jgi:DNA invertase Pin-like site-specific DNA recombinase